MSRMLKFFSGSKQSKRSPSLDAAESPAKNETDHLCLSGNRQDSSGSGPTNLSSGELGTSSSSTAMSSPIGTAEFAVQIVGNSLNDGHTAYHMKVTDLASAEIWDLTRRYREFRELHEHLKLKYPDRIPSFPGKRLFGNQDPQFIKQRQQGLQTYLNGVLQLEPDCRTKALSKFLEIRHRSADQASASNSNRATGGAVQDGSMVSDATATSPRMGSPSANSDALSPGSSADANAIAARGGVAGSCMEDGGGALGMIPGNGGFVPVGGAGATAPVVPVLSSEQIVEKTQAVFIDLAQCPTSLEPLEIEERLKKYTLAIKTHIATQPIDPIFLATSHPVSASCAGEAVNPAVFRQSLINTEDSFDEFCAGLQPDLAIANPSKLVVPFPEIEG